MNFRVREVKPTKLLQKIFDLRKKKKITLVQLGKVMGDVEGTTASNIENGYIPLKAQYLPAIAKLLGVETWELFADFKAGEIGPISEEEKELLLKVRELKQNDYQKLREVFGLMAKKKKKRE